MYIYIHYTTYFLLKCFQVRRYRYHGKHCHLVLLSLSPTGNKTCRKLPHSLEASFPANKCTHYTFTVERTVTLSVTLSVTFTVERTVTLSVTLTVTLKQSQLQSKVHSDERQ